MIYRLLLLLLALASPALADLRLAHIFQDHMVLQRDMPLPVWGRADAGAAVTVQFAGQTRSVKADDQGKWRVTLEPLAASAQGRALTVSAGEQKIERTDVLVGEVWVLAGQSNMARGLHNDSFDYPFFKDYLNDAESPAIRFVTFGGGSSSTPLDDVEPAFRKDTPWKPVSRSTAGGVMSIGFFFARNLTKELNVPVGLVQVAVSGTPQTAWMPRETYDQLFTGDRAYDKVVAELDARMAAGSGKFKSYAEYEKALQVWRNDPAATPQQWPGARDNLLSDYPTVLYNTRIHPLVPMAFRGMLWHQGEAGPYGPYGQRMLATVDELRGRFGHRFCFIWGTMTRLATRPPPLAPAVGNLRANITLAMIEGDLKADERSALVNLIDLGNAGTHWAMKEEAGRRMFLAAMDRAFGRPSVFTGPQLVRSEIQGNQVTCTFRHAGGGLTYTPTIDGISGFVAVDKAGGVHWAEVRVTGRDTLVATIPAGEIAGLYYAVDGNPHETLFNAEGFPAFPFQVGTARAPKTPADAPQLVAITAGGGEKVHLFVSHVRREGYTFSVGQWRSTAKAEVTVRAYVPAEWQGVEVRLGEKVVNVTPRQEAGRRIVTLEVPINGDRVTIAKPGRAAELMRVNRF